MRKPKKKAAKQIAQAPIPDIAMSQALTQIRQVIFDGERLVEQQILQGDSELSHQINAHVLCAAAILHRLSPRIDPAYHMEVSRNESIQRVRA
jgi:hypothetical protein